MATSQSYLSALSDRELLDETLRMAGRARTATADLLALLAEVDSRGLYLHLGCSSLFTYCTHVLRLSEPAAYARITAARAALFVTMQTRKLATSKSSWCRCSRYIAA